MNTQTEIPN